jgi:ATP-binding cassette subfamily B protein
MTKSARQSHPKSKIEKLTDQKGRPLGKELFSGYVHSAFSSVREMGGISTRILVVGWRLSSSMMIGYVAGALLEIGGTVASIYATAQLGALLAQYLTSHTGTTAMWRWLWIDIAAALAVALGFWLMGAAKRILYFRTVAWSTRTFQAALCRYDIADFENGSVRSEINKVSSGYTWQMSNLMQNTLDFCYSLARLLALSIVIIQISWWLMPMLLLFLLPSLLGEHRLQKLQWFVWDEKGDNRHMFWGLEWILRRVKQQMELRSMQSRQYVLSKLDGMNREFYEKQENTYRRVSRFLMPTKLFEVAGIAIGSVYLLRQFISGAIGIDRYFFLSGALLRINGALNASIGALAYMQEPLLFAQSFFALVERKPHIVDSPNAITLARSPIPPLIEFEHVSFTYPGKKIPVFSDLSFTIRPGEHVALVGENGAGKTTMIKLLLRFYLPSGGRILIDGHDLRDIALESWYDRVATLFQEFNQYPLTIRENITIGRQDTAADEAHFAAALESSRVDTVVEPLPYKLDTYLDSSFEHGVEPSGGQWQRVALARAFYRDAPTLILDEPTSAIDAKAEYDIFNSIFARYENRTAIIVSHRFSTVRRAHRIIVFEAGKIVEQGTHAELMKQKSLYHELFTKQAEGYRE